MYDRRVWWTRLLYFRYSVSFELTLYPDLTIVQTKSMSTQYMVSFLFGGKFAKMQEKINIWNNKKRTNEITLPNNQMATEIFKTSYLKLVFEFVQQFS